MGAVARGHVGFSHGSSYDSAVPRVQCLRHCDAAAHGDSSCAGAADYSKILSWRREARIAAAAVFEQGAMRAAPTANGLAC
jgi:hypothetical protein